MVTPWDSVFTEPERLGEWLNAARGANIEPLIAFEHARGDSCSYGPCDLPSASAYGAALREFHARYPWVSLLTPWNEPNHESQPTYRHPRRAAAFYAEARRACRDCTLVAADVLDSPNMESWMREYSSGLAERPAVWGLHNYYDVIHLTTRGVERFLTLVTGDVWLTEVGGLVFRRDKDGVVVHPYDEGRAERSVGQLFQIARRFQHRISRVYVYQWKAEGNARFDAGLLRPDGTTRPSYDVFRREAGGDDSHTALDHRPRIRVDLSGVTLSRGGDLRIPVVCGGNGAAGECNARITLESATYRRSRLINGRPRRGVLEPVTKQIGLDAPGMRITTFAVPKRAVERVRRRSRTRFRITVLDEDHTGAERKSEYVAGV